MVSLSLKAPLDCKPRYTNSCCFQLAELKLDLEQSPRLELLSHGVYQTKLLGKKKEKPEEFTPTGSRDRGVSRGLRLNSVSLAIF